MQAINEMEQPTNVGDMTNQLGNISPKLATTTERFAEQTQLVDMGVEPSAHVWRGEERAQSYPCSSSV